MTKSTQKTRDTQCQGGCGKVRSILFADSPTDWLCNDCRVKTKNMKRIQELRKIIQEWEAEVFYGAEHRTDESGNIIVDTFTCGTCGKSWNDALVTSYTPTPSGRCPFEYVHQEIEELNKLIAQTTKTKR